jgi:hypothetical protein
LIGGAVHTLTHVFRPEAVYLGGKLSEVGKTFLKEVRKGFTECGPLTGYEPKIALGTAGNQFGRRHVMVRGAAMTAVRGTESLVDVEKIKEKLAAAPEDRQSPQGIRRSANCRSEDRDGIGEEALSKVQRMSS